MSVPCICLVMDVTDALEVTISVQKKDRISLGHSTDLPVEHLQTAASGNANQAHWLAERKVQNSEHLI